MKILYATDGSKGAVAVADLLVRLALTQDDQILLFGVDPLPYDNPEERLFAEALACLAATPAQVETEVRSGSVTEQILARAQEWGADLIAVGAAGVTGLARFLVGSVAERVLRHATVPVLMARPICYDLARVAVAVDKSDFAVRITEQSAKFPLPATTELRLITVLPPREALVAAAPTVWAGLANELEEALRTAQHEAEEHLRELSAVIRAAGRKVTAEILRGDPASALITAVEREQLDLIVLGSRGEGGVDRFLLGSVSERVARHAPCSVLVVR